MEILLHNYIVPLELTPRQLAAEITMDLRNLFGVLFGISPITKPFAKKLAKRFDTTPDLWINLQKKWDEWRNYEK